MENQMSLNEFERRLIELVRALPEAQAEQVMALAMQSKDNLAQADVQLREKPTAYDLAVAAHEVASDEEVRAIIQRSFSEHDDVWAELAKR